MHVDVIGVWVMLWVAAMYNVLASYTEHGSAGYVWYMLCMHGMMEYKLRCEI